MNDVDLAAGLITVRRTKFYKTRLVPLGPQLRQVMTRYLDWRNRQGHSRIAMAPFFVMRSGAPVTPALLKDSFAGLREYAGVSHRDGQTPNS